MKPVFQLQCHQSQATGTPPRTAHLAANEVFDHVAATLGSISPTSSIFLLLSYLWGDMGDSRSSNFNNLTASFGA